MESPMGIVSDSVVIQQFKRLHYLSEAVLPHQGSQGLHEESHTANAVWDGGSQGLRGLRP